MGRKSREKRVRHAPEPGLMVDVAAGVRLRPSPSMPGVAPRIDTASHPPASIQVTPEYAIEGERAERLLSAGDTAGAQRLFESALATVGSTPSYGRAVLLGRLGRCLYMQKREDAAAATVAEALAVVHSLAASDGVTALRGTLLSVLGEIESCRGHPDRARSAHLEALAIARAAGDHRAQAVDLSHLAALALASNSIEDAEQLYHAALAAIQKASDPIAEAAILHQLGSIANARGERATATTALRRAAQLRETHGLLRLASDSWLALAECHREAGELAEAVACHQRAVGIAERIGEPIRLATHMAGLSALLCGIDGCLAQAQAVAGNALVCAQSRDCLHPINWTLYGTLAAIVERQLDAGVEPSVAEAMRAQLRDFRALASRAPRIVETFRQLDENDHFGLAVTLGSIGRCLLAGRRPDLAVEYYRKANATAQMIAGGVQRTQLQAMLWQELGVALRADSDDDGARHAFRVAVGLSASTADRLGQIEALHAIAGIATAADDAEEATRCARAALSLARELADEELSRSLLQGLPTLAPAEVIQNMEAMPPTDGFSLFSDTSIEYVFDSDLLIDGRTMRTVEPVQQPNALAMNLRPTLKAGVRTYPDADGAAWLCLDLDEPEVQRREGCTVLQRTRRRLRIGTDADIAWALVRLADGSQTIEDLLTATRCEDPDRVTRMVTLLAGAGMLDCSGRPLGRLVHALTKKGVIAGSGLHGDAVLALATDGSYRHYPDAARLPVSPAVPDRLTGFHELTRQRRSRRDYNGTPISLSQLEALLHTACGVTGTLRWSDRELKLRAYPASGALYAVEIYPVVFDVDGLDAGVYHYLPAENEMEQLAKDFDRQRFIAAMLPVERQMVGAASAMICLVGEFPRHEAKYGQGGYRMMVAEAGHISQNLVLAATALGVAARPFGGVFDDLINTDLGLDVDCEQFLLSVLVGNAGQTQ